MTTCRVLVPSGVLGSGCPPEALERGLSLRPDAIAVDAGSTDSGPHYLGTGTTKMTRKAIKEDLRQLMVARDRLAIPLLIGSCGTSGTDAGVDWTAEICREIAREEGLTARVARLYSQQDPAVLSKLLQTNSISPLPPFGPLDPETLVECSHIVGLLGYEPLADALKDGADIVLAGRTTDTAVLAAVPLMRGLPPEFCWHAAKIAECGGLCTTRSRQGGVMLSIDPEGFNVEPLHAANTCSTFSVSAHLLYENSDPYRLLEPGIVLDTEHAVYEQMDDRTVRVTGTRIENVPYTMKLEGAAPAGYRTMLFSGIADPKVLASIDIWLDRLSARLHRGISEILGYDSSQYELDIRPYGWNALDPSAKKKAGGPPIEVGLMLLATAQTQEHATEIAKYCNPFLLHFPLHDDDPLPSFAFPYSPAEVDLGPVFEFRLNHVVHLDSPTQLVRKEWESIGGGEGHDAA